MTAGSEVRRQLHLATVAICVICLPIGIAGSACTRDDSRADTSAVRTSADGDSAIATATGGPTARDAATRSAAQQAARLIPANAGLDRVADVMRDPRRDGSPGDTMLGGMIQRGYDIMRDTRKHAPSYSGNALSCANCHLNVGQKDAAWPLVGVSTLFPQYRGRTGRLITLEDRIRDCFERSMNGTAPPYGSVELLAVSAYLVWLSAGLPAGEEPAWRGRNEIPRAQQIAIADLDVSAGKAGYERTCVACHGVDGQGVNLGVIHAGPLWGPQSWNDGAGAARIYTLAGFIRHAMPLTAPGTMTDAEAQHIAAYINSQERPRFANKRGDYPDGRAPVDAVYYPRYTTHPLRR